jgi:hypothetical protein
MIGQSAAERVAQAVMDKTHKPHWQELADAYHGTIMAFIEARMPAELWHVMQVHPGAFNTSSNSTVHYKGQALGLYFRVNHYTDYALLNWTSGASLAWPGREFLKFDPTYDPLAEDIVLARDALADYVTDAKGAYTKLVASIRAHASWKALAKAWPEMAPHVPENFLKPNGPSMALVDYGTINKLVGLPVPEEQA